MRQAHQQVFKTVQIELCQCQTNKNGSAGSALDESKSSKCVHLQGLQVEGSWRLNEDYDEWFIQDNFHKSDDKNCLQEC